MVEFNECEGFQQGTFVYKLSRRETSTKTLQTISFLSSIDAEEISEPVSILGLPVTIIQFYFKIIKTKILESSMTGKYYIEV